MLEERALANDTPLPGFDSRNPTRRNFLTRAPLAVAALAAPVAALASVPDENPKLLELGAEFPAVEKAYQDALANWQAAWTEWSPQWPLAPEPCCNKWGWGHSREMERDLTGQGLIREGEKDPWYIKTADEMERDLEMEREMLAKDHKRKRSYGKAWRQYRHDNIAEAELGLALLPAYLAERDRIKRESNFETINKARHRTSEDLFAFARRVLGEPSYTLAGVKIKAEACSALGRMHSYDATWGHVGDSTKNKSSMAGLLGQALLDAARTGA